MQNIGILVEKLHIYSAVITTIQSILYIKKISNIIDLCSGWGSSAIYVHQSLSHPELTTLLTDIYPQKRNDLTSNILLDSQPLNVNHIQIKPRVLYTMYNAFHHLDDEEKKALIQKMVKNHASFVFCEILRPGWLSFIQVSLASIFGVLLFTPWIRPFEWKRLLLTYIIPLNLVTVLIDGYISILKSKNVKEYQKMFYEEIQLSKVEVLQIFQFPTFVTIIKSK
jgi:hypothetical protein